MNNKTIDIKCIEIVQPIGTFFIGSIPSKNLREITYSDVRRIENEDREIESYLGIQRPLNQKRVKDIMKYVESPDSCFPTAVILAIDGRCANYDSKKSLMSIFPYKDDENESNNIPYERIAKVIDGQHRIEGLSEYHRDNFNINVSIFIDMDISDQAYLFSTVNLAQTKVNKSLVYDLYDLAKKRSPQKTCHNIAIALDNNKDSPFYQRIKRLGVATEGRFNETLTQATVVESLLKYISKDPLKDRNDYLKGNELIPAEIEELKKLIFRNMFINNKDLEITDIIWNYFEAIRQRWPDAWNKDGSGYILNKTNGFKSFMRFLRDLYLYESSPGKVPKIKDFKKHLDKIKLNDDNFTTEEYKPGSSGESKLYNDLKRLSNI